MVDVVVRSTNKRESLAIENRDIRAMATDKRNGCAKNTYSGQSVGLPESLAFPQSPSIVCGRNASASLLSSPIIRFEIRFTERRGHRDD
jgi:hypothetical protein